MSDPSGPADDKDILDMLSIAALDIPRLRADTEALVQSFCGPAALGSISNILRRAEETESALMQWLTVARDEIGRHENDLGLGDATVGSTIPSNPLDLHVASTLNTYRVYRIYVLQARLKCLDLMDCVNTSMGLIGDDTTYDRARCTSTLQQMCDDICGSVPYFLDNEHVPLAIGESFISSALITVSFVEILPTAQRTYVDNLLEQIAFSDRQRTGSELVFDARIMLRMGKFMKSASAIERGPGAV